MFIPEKIFAVLDALTDHPHFCIAYSGGMDSHALLHTMAKCRKQNPSLQVRALHINHRLNPNADQWEAHCKQVCETLKIPFHAERLDLNIRPSDSIEAVARKARYEVFQQIIHDEENILTAHTQNDQAETFLLQLLRGAGIKGLSAMPMKKKLGKGYLLRPLLNTHRDDLKKYAEKENLHWIEDEMNLELRFNRNYLRHEVLPVLRRRWPEVFEVISRSAGHCAEATILLDQLADSDLQTIQVNNELNITLLLQLTPERQRNVLRRWIHRQGFRVPQKKQLEQIRIDVLKSSKDANPIFAYDGIEVRRHAGKLYLSRALSHHDVTAVFSWNLKEPLKLPNDLGVLTATKKKGKGVSAPIDTNGITVRFRQGGERCQPVGRKETHSLKKLMQEWNIPTWQRDRIPLIYYNEELIAVVGYCICKGFSAKGEEFGWIISSSLLSRERWRKT